MKVKPNQNSGILAPAQESEANIKDGTSNTVQFAESSKSEKPFAKDSFENFRFEGAVDFSETPRDGEKVIENVNVKYTFMDYTDDDFM